MKRRSALLLWLLMFCLFIIPASAESASPSEKQIVLVSTLEITDVPAYSGDDYLILNDNNPDFYIWQINDEPFVIFSPLDKLGRTGAGMACLGEETLPKETRGEIGDVHPSGWQNERYDDLIEDRYLYNRAHVIGHMLCGDNGTPENIFTGTRYLNAGSMLQFELRVLDYIEKTGNHVLYRVTPMYHEEDLVATGVQMEAWSVEDNGAGVAFNVFVYNIQPGIRIDYRTGESERNTDTTIIEVLTMPEQEREKQETDVQSRSISAATDEAELPVVTYILNTSSKRFHYPDCQSVSDMKEKNKQEFYGTRDEAIAAGYLPCGNCHP